MSSLEDVKKVIKSLVIPHQNGLSAVSLNSEWLEFEGRDIPWKSFGATSLVDFLLSLTDIIRVGTNKAGAQVFFPIVDQSTAHIAKFVLQQKPQPIKRRANDMRLELDKRPRREPSPVRQRSPPRMQIPEPGQNFRNPSPPAELKNKPFRPVSPERGSYKSQVIRSPSPVDPYEESLKRAREKRGITRRSHRSRRSRSRSQSPRRDISPSSRRPRSPDPWRPRSPDPWRPRSPSPRRARSPSPRRYRSPSPRRGRSPSPSRRPRSPTQRPSNKNKPKSPTRRGRSPNTRRIRSPIIRHDRTPSPIKSWSPSQSRARSPIQRRIETKSISCQTDFEKDEPKPIEKTSISCQTDISNEFCNKCRINNNNNNHNNNNNNHNQQPAVNGQRHSGSYTSEEDYTYANYNGYASDADLNLLYYGSVGYDNKYNPDSELLVPDPCYEEDTGHNEPGYYYDWNEGHHKPIPLIPENHAYWIMLGYLPPQTNPQHMNYNHQPMNPPSRAIPAASTAANVAKPKDPRLSRSAAAAVAAAGPAVASPKSTPACPSVAERISAKRKPINLNDYKQMRALGGRAQPEKSEVIVNDETRETRDTLVSETTESVVKLSRDPRLRRSATTK